MLRYIVSSQRTTIRYIPNFLENVDGIGFFDPDAVKLREFKKLKHEYGGSYFAYHGTKSECTYSVTR